MGIRFTCHACNKRLNVKAFLAGKRGICPHCGAKVDIPWESQTDGGPVQSSVPRGAAAPHVPTGPPDQLESNNGSANGSAAAPSAAPAQTQPAQAQAVASSSGPAVPMGAPMARAVPAAPAYASPPQPDQPTDPIDEAPGAVWYVRPTSGGQYGPASGEIMRKWISEGRVSADSLVWREGWPDWKSAGSQFPQIAGGNPSTSGTTPSFPSQPASGVGISDPSASPSSRVYTRRRKNNSLAVVLIVVLTLASFALLGVLIAVIQFLQ